MDSDHQNIYARVYKTKRKIGKLGQSTGFILVHDKEKFDKIRSDGERACLNRGNEELSSKNQIKIKTKNNSEIQKTGLQKKQIYLPKTQFLEAKKSIQEQQTQRKQSIPAHYIKYLPESQQDKSYNYFGRHRKQQCVIKQQDYIFVQRIQKLGFFQFSIQILEEIFIGLQHRYYENDNKKNLHCQKQKKNRKLQDRKQTPIQYIRSALPQNQEEHISQTLYNLLHEPKFMSQKSRNNILKQIYNHWFSKKTRYQFPLIRSLWPKDLQFGPYKQRQKSRVNNLRNKTKHSQNKISKQVIKDLHDMKNMLQMMLKRNDVQRKMLLKRADKTEQSCSQIFKRQKEEQKIIDKQKVLAFSIEQEQQEYTPISEIKKKKGNRKSHSKSNFKNKGVSFEQKKKMHTPEQQKIKNNKKKKTTKSKSKKIAINSKFDKNDFSQLKQEIKQQHSFQSTDDIQNTFNIMHKKTEYSEDQIVSSNPEESQKYNLLEIIMKNQQDNVILPYFNKKNCINQIQMTSDKNMTETKNKCKNKINTNKNTNKNKNKKQKLYRAMTDLIKKQMSNQSKIIKTKSINKMGKQKIEDSQQTWKNKLRNMRKQ